MKGFSDFEEPLESVLVLLRRIVNMGGISLVGDEREFSNGTRTTEEKVLIGRFAVDEKGGGGN